MAFQMSFTDQYGDNYPESYWNLQNIRLSANTQSATLDFAGYESSAKVNGRVIGEHSYTLTSAQYAALAATALSSLTGAVTVKDAIDAVAYGFAMSALDTNGVSFFNGATTVV